MFFDCHHCLHNLQGQKTNSIILLFLIEFNKIILRRSIAKKKKKPDCAKLQVKSSSFLVTKMYTFQMKLSFEINRK